MGTVWLILVVLLTGVTLRFERAVPAEALRRPALVAAQRPAEQAAGESQRSVPDAWLSRSGAGTQSRLGAPRGTASLPAPRGLGLTPAAAQLAGRRLRTPLRLRPGSLPFSPRDPPV